MKRLFSVLFALLFAASAHAASTTAANAPAYAGPATITSGTITGITDIAVADGGTGASTAQGAAANLSVPYVLCQSAVAVSVGAVTTEETLYTCTIPANSIGPNGSFRLRAILAMTNSVNNKTIRVRYSGAGGTTYDSAVATTTAFYALNIFVSNRNATNSQVGSYEGYPAYLNNVMPTFAKSTSAVDTTAPSAVLVTCQKASAGETCSLDRISVELLYGAFLSLDRFAPDALRNAVAANDFAYQEAA